MTQKIIVDGDFGGDEMQLLAVLLAHPEKFSIVGATAVHGNTNHDQVLENCGSILSLLNADHIVPRYAGSKYPSDNILVEGDGAHGDNGMGDITTTTSAVPAAKGHAVDFILDQLENNPAHTVTITATGPLTNIAKAFQKNPDVMQRVKEIVIMGGCTEEIPAHDMPYRKGNITPHAEFNFHVASLDAAIVMDSGLPISLFPMNCTQQLSFTPAREKKLRDALSSEPEKCEQIIGMMKAAEWLDQIKFNSFNFMHDIHTALFLTDKKQYAGTRGYVHVDFRNNKGQSNFVPAENGAILVLEKALNPDHLYGVFLQSIEKVLLRREAQLAPAPVFQP